MSSLLSLVDLVKTYGGRKVVDRASIRISGNRVVGLLGPNGAGKTTTFYMAVGMIKPDSGTVSLDGEEVTRLPMYQRARKGIGYLPQETSVFRKLSVRENILVVLEYLGLPDHEMQDRADHLLDELGIRNLEHQRASSLSGGERRRLEIARALSTKPAFILLDEPFAGIDPLAVIDIKNIIGHLRNKGIGILISDHNVRETLGVCDEAYILSEGKVIEHGVPETIAASPVCRKIYLGEDFTL
ncbi:LPS export ABC transporter ATP-binding protein [Desulfatirhabdium butyrativorans]|uniref:LPS export ABC transporter ATP-binding protein n=1 Tax=Desulfatirhabdium butyrativorans TaxID=340467 RepID=UPI000488EF5B